MKTELRYWGTRQVGVVDEAEQTPLRVLIDSELSDARLFVEQLYREYSRSGRRAETARLLESRRNLPWPSVGSTTRSA